MIVKEKSTERIFFTIVGLLASLDFSGVLKDEGIRGNSAGDSKASSGWAVSSHLVRSKRFSFKSESLELGIDREHSTRNGWMGGQGLYCLEDN